MNAVSTGCGDNVEDGKGNSDGATPNPNPTGGWFWITDPAAATNKKKMRTSQSTSSLQLFTLKTTKPSNIRQDKGAAAENTRDDVSDDHQDEVVNDEERNVVLRKSVSLIDIEAALDKELVTYEFEVIPVTPMEEEGVERGNLESKLKGFGDEGIQSGIEAHSVSSVGSDDHDDREGPQEQDDALRKSAESGQGEENKNEQNGKKQDGHTRDFRKLHQLEEKLIKSQATTKMLHKANMGYQDEITNLTKTLEEESETRRALHEGLEASRKLCCELYEDLLQERTKCRSTEIAEVERHLSPKVLKFSLSDAAVQTDVERVDYFNLKADQNPPYSFRDKQNVSSGPGPGPGSFLPTQGSMSYPQATEIPRYGFYLSHLLEEYKENQKNLEVQLKNLSAQCREKDEDLKGVKDKLGGHIRLNTLLQSEKVCLEETVEQLREELKSCDHLIQSCDSVLKEKDREIRRLQEAKYELERRVAEFEYREKELQGMVCGFQDDIGDLASERKKLCKCVKKASKHQSPRQQVKVPQPTKKATDERGVELQAKAELLNAIREIAFKFSTSPSKSTYPQLKGDKADREQSLKGQPKKQTTGDDDKEKESCTARSVKEPIPLTRENSLIVKKTSACSISQESVSTYDTLNSELEDESLPSAREEKGESQRHESFQHERSTCTDLNSDGHPPTGKVRELERRKKLEKTVYMYMESKDVKTRNMKKMSIRDLDGQEVKASGVFHRSSHHGDLTVLGGLEDDDEEKEKDEVISSCHNLYSDVMNELSCKNAAAKMTTATTATEGAPAEACTGTDGKDCNSLEDASSNDRDDQLKPTDWRASLDSPPTSLDSSSDDFLDTVTKSGANMQPAAKKTTGSRKVIASMEEEENYEDTSDDDDYDLKFYKNQDHLSSNNSNDSDNVKGSNAQTVEPRKLPDSFATVKGTKQDQVDETTDLELGSENIDDLLSWESPQRVEEMRKGDVSRSHRISPNHCGDDLQEDDLEFCVTDEEYDVGEQDGKCQNRGEETVPLLDYHEEPTFPWNERDFDLYDEYMHQKKVKQVTEGLQIRNNIFQSGRHSRSTGQRQSPNSVRIKKEIANRFMKHSNLDPVDSGRQTRHPIATGRKDMDNGVISSGGKTLKDSSGPFSVRHSPHGRYSSLEDSDDLHLEDIHDLSKTGSEESESSCDSSREASPAEGLILRKQVMENYATRANDRAWHYVYMKQDGPRLMFYKDRMGKELGAHIEEPLVLTNAIISVAKDYFIRKHAFRVQLPNGHQCLFAAKDDREMMYWVCRLDAAGAPPTSRHGDAYSSRNPAAITTIPPPTSGSPTRSERFKNLIKGGISALLK
ncbi:uncharacterized protein LOC100893159 [Strongylocentrotus purpuratus]|uniref:PH domain-containing protein n=1 Tax=Strongylocentrotus purpuratus TaxID=7668 RepID=A0A7M7PU73_STRPU|nr:uncharacterized protein LOC100893159 [Strongylocentrotus purpuratus]